MLHAPKENVFSYLENIKNLPKWATRILQGIEERIQVKCADCNCLPDECKESASPRQCPNCTWQECCCWTD